MLAVPQIFSTSRNEATSFQFPLSYFIPLMLVALGLHAYLPVLVPGAHYLNWPLLAVIYWACTARSPMTAALVGATMGLAQDSLSNSALGIHGIAFTLTGYVAALGGARLDSDHPGIRLVLVAGGYVLAAWTVNLLQRFLLGTPLPLAIRLTLLAALLNACIAVLIYRPLDRLRRLA